MKKVLTIIVTLSIVVAVALTIFIKIYITPDKVKDLLVPQVEEALGRSVEIGDIRIGILRGIEISDFVLKEADGKTDFFTSDEFVLKYSLLPLLSKKVLINELRMSSPQLRIIRNKEGIYNFESIGRHEPGERREKRPSGERGASMSLLVRSISVRDAMFTFEDEKKELPGIKGSVDITTGLQSAKGKSVTTDGKITITLDEIEKGKTGERIGRISAGIEYGITVDLASEDINIRRGDITFQEVPLSLTGHIKNFRSDPDINLSVSLPETAVDDLVASMAPFFQMKGVALSGAITAGVTVSGEVKKPDLLAVSGKLTGRKVGIDHKGVHTVLNGQATLEGQTLNVHIDGTGGSSSFQVTGSVRDYLKEQKINLNLSSGNLVLDEVIPAFATLGEGRSQKSAPEKAEQPQEAESLDLKLTADGEVRIDTALYRGLQMKDFFMTYQFRNNRFEIREMTASAGEGKFSLRSLVDFSKPGYAYNLNSSIDSLQAHEVVNAFFPKARDTVFGVLSLNLALSGKGTLPHNMKKNLVGNGDFIVRDGKITNSTIPEGLARFLGIEELKTIILKEARGTVNIQNGMARLESIFSSDSLKMDPSGDIGLDETLDLSFDLKLSGPLTERATLNSGIARYIRDEEGWGTVPLVVSGTFTEPSYGIDIEKAGKRVIQKKTEKLIQDLLKKEKDTKQPGEGKDGKDTGRPLDDVLKQLF
jgi:AsmA protein